MDEVLCGSLDLERRGLFSKHRNVPLAFPKASANVTKRGNVKIEERLFILWMREDKGRTTRKQSTV
jgi:hypothetical protein